MGSFETVPTMSLSKNKAQKEPVEQLLTKRKDTQLVTAGDLAAHRPAEILN